MKIRTLLAAAIAVGAMTPLSVAEEKSYATAIAEFSAKKAQAKAEKEESTKPTLLQAILRGGEAGNKADGKKSAVKAAKTKKVSATSSTPSQPSAKRKSVKLSSRSKGKGGGSYHTIISHYASSYGVPVSLASAVVRVESNYRANARGAAGEIGLMQIKPATARMMGYRGSTKGLYNPETNIKYGMKYLAKAHKLGGGSTCGTILKYNAGHGAKRMNPISSRYCAKVKRILGQ